MKIGAVSTSTAAPITSSDCPLFTASTVRRSRARQISSTGSMNGSTELSNAYANTAATFSATWCSLSAASSTTPSAATIMRHSLTLCTLLLVCSSTRKAKKRGASESPAASLISAGLASSNATRSLRVYSGMGSSSSSRDGHTGRSCFLTMAFSLSVTLPGSLALGPSTSYSPGSPSIRRMMSHISFRHRKRQSPLSEVLSRVDSVGSRCASTASTCPSISGAC
mmetsp:Transcript_13021/g.24874  ORF Transcript_13021/g.24874 Transcript_13021/m.24874 type:complete len:224 (+) Transcript_13021:478-1149(+)